MVFPVVSAIAGLGGVEDVQPRLPVDLRQQHLGNVTGVSVLVWRNEGELLGGAGRLESPSASAEAVSLGASVPSTILSDM